VGLLTRRTASPERISPDAVARWVPHAVELDTAEAALLLERARMVAQRLRWEPAYGFAITGAAIAAIAANAAFASLGLAPDVLLRSVRTVVVHPTTMLLTGPRPGPSPYTVTDRPLPVLGHTSATGPLHLAWDAVEREVRHPEAGRNVVHHEIAHRLDLLDGTFDGTPPFSDDRRRRRWITVCQAAYDELRRGVPCGVLRPYAATNPAEFFAVATEAFFTVGAGLRANWPALYAVLSDYYGQDPAGRAVLGGHTHA
jgi:Mlc titration factor MtfA (ptsG expression regulator)